MKSLSVIELSKLYNINRQTIYNNINRGILSKNSDNKIDLSEAIRVFGEPIKKGNVKEDVKIDKIESAEVLLLRQQVDMLKNQLDDAKGRESFYQNQIETMQRLLEAPKDKVTSFTEQKNNQDIAVESNFKESIQEEELSNLKKKKRSFFSSFFSKK
ncbi:plasmid replication DNA-binding protein [Acinetobacter pollinis]|uniref:plasmid replication DNA-binding protein n=1 Tax=Acinetobacter pollinis TaxID=2605270 RepID=UPI0018A2A16C|nr:plasmid replication DNA-binding protein [Acinetobacter pollinis]MBF7691662.1 DNA-binding protein [Acinetobacter pollinis]MBF7699304.1 DNA-binding protein [Acinetobacter pollinis]